MSRGQKIKFHDLKVPPDSLLFYLRANCNGRDHAQSGAEVAAALNVTETKRLRETVNYLRKKNIPVGSCSKGYFWPATAEESWDVYYYLVEGFAEQRLAAEGVRKGNQRRFGPRQLTLDLNEGAA